MVGISTMADMDVMDISHCSAQMESFQRSDEARQKLLTSVLEKYAELMKEHTNLKNDFESERNIRRSYQNEAAQSQSQLSVLQRDMDNNSFVLALVDGDGVIFQDMLLQLGAQGGSDAASRLQLAIREHVASIYSHSTSWPIMVQIYASLDKLSQKLAQVGLLKHPKELREFAQSFSVNQPLFSIIDVGQGKERADFRIKEMLRTFSDNPTCKHIIFGGCHDAGYLLNLDQYKHNEAKAGRITLLESTVPVRGFAELPNFKRARFDEIFRANPLPEYGMTQYMQAPPQPPNPALVRTLTDRSLSPVANTTPAPGKPTPVPIVSSPSTTDASLAGQQNDTTSGSWATVGKNGTVNGNISIAPKNASKKKYVYYNKDGYRLDEPLPPRDRSAVEAVEKRMEQSRRNLCNHFHLNKGQCINGSFCKFQHEPKLSAAELNALRYKARSLGCKRRDCDNFDCYLGHQCTFERDQGHCPFPDSCHLRFSHGMDKTKYERWDEDGNVEYAN